MELTKLKYNTNMEECGVLVASHVLLHHLECPCCKELLLYNIKICPMGHSICDKCCKQLQKCLICDRMYHGGRNFALESLLSCMYISCQYRSGGCLKHLAVKEYKQHLSSCEYRKRKCYSTLDDKNEYCSWTGTLEEMFDHFRKEHKNLVVADGNTSCTWDFYSSKFGVNLVQSEYFLVRACLTTGNIDNLCFAMIPKRAKLPKNYEFMTNKCTGGILWKLDFQNFQLDHACFQNGDFLDDPQAIENIANYNICLSETNFRTEFCAGLVKYRAEVNESKQLEFFAPVT